MLLFWNNNMQQGGKFPLHDDILFVMVLYCKTIVLRRRTCVIIQRTNIQVLLCCVFMIYYFDLIEKFFFPAFFLSLILLTSSLLSSLKCEFIKLDALDVFCAWTVLHFSQYYIYSSGMGSNGYIWPVENVIMQY